MGKFLRQKKKIKKESSWKTSGGRNLVQSVKKGVRTFKKTNPQLDLKTRAKIGIVEAKHRFKIGKAKNKLKKEQKKNPLANLASEYKRERESKGKKYEGVLSDKEKKQVNNIDKRRSKYQNLKNK